jgi:predicted acyltransferase
MTQAPEIPVLPSSSRSLSLDIFRGMTICFMIIVNTPGSDTFTFSPLRHAHWNGCTPTDLVFPSFLFAVGNAMSFARKKFATMSNGAILGKIFKRTLLIFLLGFLLYWFPFFQSQNGHLHLSPISHTRILGVLQRIALCYFFASLLIQYLSTRAVLFISAILLIGYWLILLAAGVPGADPFGMTTNAGYRLDVLIMGQDHMYHGEGVAFDPEGILSTLPAIVNVVAGYFCGVFVQQKGKSYEGLTKMLLTGSALMAVAVGWDLLLPINKKLWTSSYVLYTVGIDLIFLSFLIYVIEFRQKKAWSSFFNVFGKNPLFIYLLSELMVIVLVIIPHGPSGNLFEWINSSFYQKVLPGAVGSLCFALSYMLVCWLVGYVLDRKKIYIRV